jgi:PAS domain S-box-containing protein
MSTTASTGPVSRSSTPVNNPRSSLLRYGSAALGIALAVWARLLLDPMLGNHFPFATLFFAVLLTAWYGGFGPALVAVLIGALAADYFLIPLRGSFRVEGRDQLLGIVLYLTVGFGIAMLGGVMQAARRKAEASAEAARHQAVLIKESEERVNLALESAQMGSWDLDLVHDTAVRSLRHDQIFGYPSLRPEWGSEIFLAHVLPEDRELVKERFQEAFATGQFDMECRILWPDQSVHWIAAQGHVYYSEKREPVRMMGVVRDVSERKRAEQVLAERSAQLEAANQELEAFAYSVSHDLRAPLRAIDGFSQVLLEDHGERLEDSGRDALVRVRAGAGRMSRLIDDLLKLSLVTRAELQRARVDLSEMARGVVAELARREPDRHVDTRIADGVVIQGDPSLLRLVLENLLGNAFKFTSKTGEARVEFGVERQNGAQVYYVRDNGAGFDAAYADKLFGAFQRLHSEAEFPGTGIGLATVQRIVHRHGGRVWAEGAVDGGATFRFTL